MINTSKFGLMASDLQTYFGFDHISIIDGASTTVNIRNFIDTFIDSYNDKVITQSATSWSDIGRLFDRAGGNPIDMYAMIQRDTTDIPLCINLLFKQLGVLNLNSVSDKAKFAIYMQLIHFN